MNIQILKSWINYVLNQIAIQTTDLHEQADLIQKMADQLSIKAADLKVLAIKDKKSVRQ